MDCVVPMLFSGKGGGWPCTIEVFSARRLRDVETVLPSSSPDPCKKHVVNGFASVWKTRPRAGGQATPMSYAVDGRQYVAVAAGGHGGLDTTSGDDVMVYALPPKSVAAPR